jgi:hypothetical protein
VTVLRLVRDTDRPGNWSRRVPPTEETLADLEWITRNVLAPADLAVAELRHALIKRDRAAALTACNRLLGAGLVWQDVADGMRQA